MTKSSMSRMMFMLMSGGLATPRLTEALGTDCGGAVVDVHDVQAWYLDERAVKPTASGNEFGHVHSAQPFWAAHVVHLCRMCCHHVLTVGYISAPCVWAPPVAPPGCVQCAKCQTRKSAIATRR